MIAFCVKKNKLVRKSLLGSMNNMFGSGEKRLSETMCKKFKFGHFSHIVSLSLLFPDPKMLFIDKEEKKHFLTFLFFKTECAHLAHLALVKTSKSIWQSLLISNFEEPNFQCWCETP